METDDYHSFFEKFAEIQINPLTKEVAFGMLILIILLLLSALVSGSEVAYFSLSPSQKKNLHNTGSNRSKKILQLLSMPERLLATILIANNFINVGIVILSSYIFSNLINFGDAKTLEFIFQIIIITFLILLFGEIIPKVFATQYAQKFAGFMAYPLNFFKKIFYPLGSVLVGSTSFIQKRIKPQGQVSIDELSHAIELASEEISEEKEMLEGIVKFSNINVQEIMCARVDIVSVELKTSFPKLKSVIVESGFSRIPVFNDDLDKIEGIIHVKDLIPYISKPTGFKWQHLIRTPYFVPESKKINQLLTEFQAQKNHMAIVVDEYGGTSGIITMEDILEEIVGEISDEFDVNEETYEKLKDGTYVFWGKTQLNDLLKILDIEEGYFDKIRGDADTLAGLILEIKGEIPQKGEKFNYKNYTFTIESSDKRRIKKIRLVIKNTK